MSAAPTPIGPADQLRITSAQIKAAAPPEVVLPGGATPIIETAMKLGKLVDATGRFFRRGGAVVTLAKDDEGQMVLSPVETAALPSTFEEVATLQKWAMSKDGPVLKPSVCNESTAKLILHSERFITALPLIRVVSRCPVLTERDGNLIVVSGYDRESGILAAGTVDADVELEVAREFLHELLEDFDFSTPSDKSRALAAVITPALVMGGLLGGRAPIDLGEADDSQAGKGFRNKLTAAIYNHGVKAVTQKRGGVGSLEESFNAALIAGYPFICFDNVRGKIDSPAVESFCTEDNYLARVPFSPSVEIDPRRVVLMLTSNMAEITPDLANRSSCVRIRKRNPDYKYAAYSEGDLLDHVRAQQPLFLGAVFAHIRAWWGAGRLGTDETRHDFRRWARPLDWIGRTLLGAAPLLDGHRETQARMTNPALTWLREVALIVKKAGKLRRELRAYELLDLIEGTSVAIPGLSPTDDLHDDAVHRRVLQAVGRELGKCFRTGECITIDSFEVRRTETTDLNYRQSRAYEFIEPT